MKNNKYIFVADLTTAENEQDVIRNIANAKIDAGVAITRKEYNSCMQYTADVCADECNELIRKAAATAYAIAMQAAKIQAESEKKPNVFKRAWNKITGKK